VSVIYKLLDRQAWLAASAQERFDGSPVDLADGFIHFSTAEQVQETACRHFNGVADLMLLAVETEALGVPVTWEPSRGGDLFPHLYGAMPVSAVISARPLSLDAEAAPVIGTLAP
jgi:uncharacterized protein (DUF952 family)